MRLSRISKKYDNLTAESQVEDIYIERYEYEDDISIFESDNKKALLSYVLTIKAMVRKTTSYSSMMKFLKEYGGLDRCGVHPNLTHDQGFSIEIHHTPLTIEDIIYTVLRKRYLSHEDIRMCSVAEEIMMLHYGGLIGLYPLCETCHAYVHSEDSDLFIPLDKIYGNPVEFVRLYKPYMKPELENSFAIYMDLNKGLSIIEDHLPQSLIKKYIYINNTDNEHLISTSKLISFINDNSK